jgi:hypothetical protein
MQKAPRQFIPFGLRQRGSFGSLRRRGMRSS